MTSGFVARSIIAGTMVAFLFACDAGEPPRPDIILISLDTLRRDAVGAFGHESSSLTPHLDRLARDGVVFERAYVPVPFTLPSHMSMFTGLYNGVHRVETKDRALGPRIRTLPEYLESAGYATAGVHTNEWIDAKFGFGRGFDVYEQVSHELTYAPRVTARALERWDEMAGSGGPRFLFIHYLDPHSDWGFRGNKLPYYSPERYREDLELDDELFCDERGRCSTQFLVAADQEGRALLEPALRLLHSLYERGVRSLDDELKVLFDELKRRGDYDDTWILLASDHGEEFREHGELLHAQVYEESLAIPLIVKFPGNEWAGARVDRLVEILDVLPTVLERLNVEPLHPLQGASLLPLLEGEERPRRFALGQDKLDREVFALFDERYKLVLDRRQGTVELYDLRADPDEQRNVAESEPERAGRMRGELQKRLSSNEELARILASGVEGQESILTTEQEERLRSLGYLR